MARFFQIIVLDEVNKEQIVTQKGETIVKEPIKILKEYKYLLKR